MTTAPAPAPQSSLAAETERFRRLLSQLTEAEQEAIFEALPDAVAAQGLIWRDNIEPMPFDEFCVAMDGMSLYPRQFEAFSKPGLLRASKLLAGDRQLREWVLLWGKGCVSGQHLLTDRSSGETKTAAEWERDGRPITLLTTDGRHTFEARSQGGVAHIGCGPLLRVRLADGREFTISPEHRFQTLNGERKAYELVAGESRLLTQPLSSSPQNLYLTPKQKAEEISDHNWSEGDQVGQNAVSDTPASLPLFFSGLAQAARDSASGAHGLPDALSPRQFLRRCASRQRRGLRRDTRERAALGRSERESGAGPQSVGAGRQSSCQVSETPAILCCPSLPSSDCPPFRPVCGPSVCHRGAGFPGDCRICLRLYGVRPPVGPGADRAGSPLPGDAPGRSRCVHQDGQGIEPGCSHFCQHSGLCLGETFRWGNLGFSCECRRRSVFAAAPLRIPLSPGRVPVGSCRQDSGYSTPQYPFYTPYSPTQVEHFPIEYTLVEAIMQAGDGDYYSPEIAETGYYFDDDGVLQGNSGKDYLVSKFIAYIAYCVLHIEGDPCLYFRQFANNLAPESELSVLNVAPDEDTAKRIFFAYLKRWIGHTLFKPFAPVILTDRIHFQRVNPHGVVYNAVSIYSMHSRAAGLDGYNLLAWVMDEADAFTDSEKVSNADLIHDILRTSANTRMGKAWFGMIITYTRAKEGFAMRIYKRAEENPVMYFRDLAASWEVNPRFDRTSEEVLEMYRYRPREAAGMYECRPSEVMDAFFEFEEKIDEAISSELTPCCDIEYKIITRGSENGNQYQYESVEVSNIRRLPGRAYFLGGDSGAKKDSFVISVWSLDQTTDASEWFCPRCGVYEEIKMGAVYLQIDRNTPQEAISGPDVRCGMCGCTPLEFHPALGLRMWWQRQQGAMQTLRSREGVEFRLPILREECIIRVVPYTAHGVGEQSRTVDFLGVYEAAKALCVGLGVSAAAFDPWQTISISQGLIAEVSANVEEASMVNADQYRRATLVKYALYSGLLQLLPGFPLRDREWRRLQDVNNHTKVDHPKSLAGIVESKDIYDAEAIAIWLAAASINSNLAADWV